MLVASSTFSLFQRIPRWQPVLVLILDPAFGPMTNQIQDVVPMIVMSKLGRQVQFKVSSFEIEYNSLGALQNTVDIVFINFILQEMVFRLPRHNLFDTRC
jgi:hypothetical protein